MRALRRGLMNTGQVRYLGCESEAASDRSPMPIIRIFMEYVSGGSLSKTLRTFGPMDEPLIRKHTRQIVEALAYVHVHNIAHRDIKGTRLWTLVVLDSRTHAHRIARAFPHSRVWLHACVFYGCRVLLSVVSGL